MCRKVKHYKETNLKKKNMILYSDGNYNGNVKKISIKKKKDKKLALRMLQK